ncbi:MAG TPA: hypothetical protein VLG16_05570 [Candidatus Saccharimonadales bacterium]|nr:hypothetical protein [Candidatus Saccharimonadales bacterium]
MKSLRRLAPYLLLLILAATGFGVVVKRDAITDWAVLQNYMPPANVAQLASQTTMTSLAKHYFYVNKPQIEGKDAFNTQCTNKIEQSVVLGCFHGNRQGIFIFNVTTPELDGVQQVTAAHEMLHQAYQRLNSSEKQRVDSMLSSYYKTGLTDQTIKDQMASYQKSEPNDVVDEMHSVFGTEATRLPADLEQYYRRYFTNRSVVTGFYTQYQAAFTSRNQQIMDYDSQLTTQKQQIDALQALAMSQLQTLNAQKSQMDAQKAGGDIHGYNAMVDSYNQMVNQYNAQLDVLRQEIDGYNKLVAARNAIAVQEQQLQQDLSSQSLPSVSGQ